MDGHREFASDCAILLREQLAKAPIARRRFLRICAYLGISPLLFKLTPAAAQSRELVLVNFGGDAIAAMNKAFVERFVRDNPDIKVAIDGAGPSSGKIKAMVESGRTTWDVCDRNLPASIELGMQNLLEKIDYGVVDKTKVRPEHIGEWGVGSYIYSNVLTYDTKAFGGRKPTTWKDFWNVKDFPGKRTLRKHIDGQLEAALLADGVAPKDIYPIDVKRALDKIKEIKPHTIFWGAAAESQQMFRNREVAMGALFSTRASVAKRESNGDVDFTFNQGSVWVGAWIVPKGTQNRAEAMKFIASTQDPHGQVELLRLLGNGPVNPEAAKLVPAEFRSIDPGQPENYAVQIPANAAWYARNSAAALNQYLEAVSS